MELSLNTKVVLSESSPSCLSFFAIRISWKNKLFLVVCEGRLFKVNNSLLNFWELAHCHVKGAEWKFVLLLDSPVLSPSPSGAGECVNSSVIDGY